MNPRTKKSLQEFKKSIKKEYLEKKKQQIRKTLPYYHDLFPNNITPIHQSSNHSHPTNSRSSRFPVRKCQSMSLENSHSNKSSIFERDGQNWMMRNTQRGREHFRQEYDKEEEEQMRLQYLSYLEHLNSITPMPLQTKQLIEHQMTRHFGNSCFSNLQFLQDCTSYELSKHEMNLQKLVSQQGGTQSMTWQQQHQQVTTQDWMFILAAYRQAQIENCSKMVRSAFGLMARYFNEWYQLKVSRIIHSRRNLTIDEMFQHLKELEEIQLQVQGIILWELLGLAGEVGNENENQSRNGNENSTKDNNFNNNSLQNNNITSSHYQPDLTYQLDLILTYFRQKLTTFRHLQTLLLSRYPIEQCQRFSQTVFNFGVTYAIQYLAKNLLSSRNGLQLQMRARICIIVNQYFSMYPLTIDSQLQTREWYISLVKTYSYQLIGVMQDFANLKGISLDQPYQQQFLSSSSLFAKAVLCYEVQQQETYPEREQKSFTEEQQGCLYELCLEIYYWLVEMSLGKQQVINAMLTYSTFHKHMLEFSILISNCNSWFIKSHYFQYLKMLTIEWHRYKTQVRSNGLLGHLSNNNNPSLTSYHFYRKVALGLQHFQHKLIHCLYISDAISEFVKQNDNELYEQVRKLLENVQTRYRTELKLVRMMEGDVGQLRGLREKLIFEGNLRLFFQLMMNSRKKKTGVINPENEQMIEI